MNARDIISHIPTLLENKLGLSISLLFREELIIMKKIVEKRGFNGLYFAYLIAKEIEETIDPTIISLLLTDAQKYSAAETNMATLLNSAEFALLYPGNRDAVTIRELYQDILYNLIQPVPITINGKVVTMDFDGDVKTTVRFAKRRDPEGFPDYKWYQAPGDKLRGNLK